MMKILSIILLSFCCCFVGCGKDNVVSSIARNANKEMKAIPKPEKMSANKDEGETPRMEKSVHGTKIVLLNGVSITTLNNVGAIVNAANQNLARGGGVCGAIYAAAGKGLEDETKALGNFSNANVKCPTGQAIITGSHGLASKGINHIIHAVGPRVSNGRPTEEHIGQLKNAYESSLKVAAEKGIRTIAFPCISTAIFGFPGDQAAPVAFNAVLEYIRANQNRFDEIIFVCYARNGEKSCDYWYYRALFDELS
jgi:O-acetyl-ADP-ribose deacetylase (regulator of RNase III)